MLRNNLLKKLSISAASKGPIPQTALPQLFNRFYRAEKVDQENVSGLGIGLYVVKEIVELHGGTVTVARAEGQGSTFTVCLPLDDAPPF